LAFEHSTQQVDAFLSSLDALLTGESSSLEDNDDRAIASAATEAGESSAVAIVTPVADQSSTEPEPEQIARVEQGIEDLLAVLAPEQSRAVTVGALQRLLQLLGPEVQAEASAVTALSQQVETLATGQEELHALVQGLAQRIATLEQTPPAPSPVAATAADIIEANPLFEGEEDFAWQHPIAADATLRPEEDSLDLVPEKAENQPSVLENPVFLSPDEILPDFEAESAIASEPLPMMAAPVDADSDAVTLPDIEPEPREFVESPQAEHPRAFVVPLPSADEIWAEPLPEATNSHDVFNLTDDGAEPTVDQPGAATPGRDRDPLNPETATSDSILSDFSAAEDDAEAPAPEEPSDSEEHPPEPRLLDEPVPNDPEPINAAVLAVEPPVAEESKPANAIITHANTVELPPVAIRAPEVGVVAIAPSAVEQSSIHPQPAALNPDGTLAVATETESGRSWRWHPVLIALLMLVATLVPWGIYRMMTRTQRLLENRIDHTFTADPQLAVYRLDASIWRNTVTLTGTLPSRDLRDHAQQLASAIAPQFNLKDEIIVVDAQTEQEVGQLMNTFNQMDGVDIRAHFEQGTVLLTGRTIYPDGATQLGEAFRQISGVTSVENLVEVEPLAIATRLYFGQNSATIPESDYTAKLMPLENSLVQHPQWQVRIVGFAHPSEENPAALAEQRAQAVQTTLEDQGLDRARFRLDSRTTNPPGVNPGSDRWLHRCVIFEVIQPAD
jgi:outer membrane protein OmpA-like peptidoglycan-associated protein